MLPRSTDKKEWKNLEGVLLIFLLAICKNKSVFKYLCPVWLGKRFAGLPLLAELNLSSTKEIIRFKQNLRDDLDFLASRRDY